MAPVDADTLYPHELEALGCAARNLFTYAFKLGSNEQGQCWGMFEPDPRGCDMLHFTVCRLENCLFIKVTARGSSCYVHGAADVEDSIVFIRQAVKTAEVARDRASATRVLN